MRILVALCAVAALGGCGFDCDPHKLLSDLAGPDAAACGVLYQDDGLEAIDAHNCARAAADAHMPFWVAIEPQSADGGMVTGFASDGTHHFALDYEYAISQGPGPDEEDVNLYECATIATPLPCTTLDSDLCFACGDGVRSGIKCHNQ